uniref:Uncharacterized protein n=1 Tax=Onchocerca volvulus TaxID=6282 RepID=A0A8R1XY30_ONCVO
MYLKEVMYISSQNFLQLTKIRFADFEELVKYGRKCKFRQDKTTHHSVYNQMRRCYFLFKSSKNETA